MSCFNNCIYIIIAVSHNSKGVAWFFLVLYCIPCLQGETLIKNLSIYLSILYK